MALFCCLVQKCSLALVLVAAVSLAAPITTSPAPIASSGSGELQHNATSEPNRTLTSQSANETTEEAELGDTPPTAIPTTDASSTNASAVTGGVLSVVTESPHGPYECSITTTTREAEDSFRKGLSLVIDEFNTRYLVYLVDEVSTCRHSARLSRLNQPIFPYINTGSGAQALANSLSKINAYAELVRAALNTNPNNTIMQALHDVLRGTAKDLYILLSPTYCVDCIDMPQCSFTIPRLAATSLFLPTCNLVSYISSTIIFELLGIELLTVGRGMGPLPDTQQWLSTHVREDSPAYNLLP